jgi:DEAD/DEAH box helicase domain-containing protein
MPVDTLTSNEQLHSFIAALQLGLKKYFKGNVDHLKTLLNQEPQANSPLRRPFLFLYDTIPGGSGYLQQLVREPDNLFSIFQEALKVLIPCDCDDGCYKCLYAYRNSFDQDQTSRKTAIDLLSTIVSRRNQLQRDSKGLSEVKLNSLFDSILEKKFIDVLGCYRHNDEPIEVRKEVVNGKPGYFLQIAQYSWNIELQAELGEAQGVHIPSRADFVFYPTKNAANLLPIVIFTDGWQYHSERLAKDFAQRMAIAKSGKYLVWSLSWSDVESQSNKQKSKDYFVDFLDKPINSQFHKKSSPLYQQYKCTILQSLARENSFTWLMNFLANPDQEQWQRLALMTTLANTDPVFSKKDDFRQQWQTALKTVIQPEIWTEFEVDMKPEWFGKAEWISSDELPLCQMYTAVSPPHHKALDPNGSLVAIWLNDQQGIADLVQQQKLWNGVIRQLNLIQFLPHTYVVTATGESSSLISPRKTSSSDTAIINPEEWQEKESLLFDEAALTLFQHIKLHQWSLPDVGYELTNERGTVVAEAELAWVRYL